MKLFYVLTICGYMTLYLPQTKPLKGYILLYVSQGKKKIQILICGMG